jgi:hypothetical protein
MAYSKAKIPTDLFGQWGFARLTEEWLEFF